ncbi:MAG: antibiotic biosynthesis monooxygenase [Anaerolineaceae bacterium]|jgi:quinol monooxygenase YgiN|nr:MAG: antibiotic biosynthesis monooxygenase [Anaerolineaceae bacterium]
MLIVIVHVHVRDRSIKDFIEATVENASKSFQEEGISFFDVIQQNDDPTKFILLEVYNDEAAAMAHKETAHYNKWKDTVTDMMAEPRFGVKYHDIYPPVEFWQKQK